VKEVAAEYWSGDDGGGSDCGLLIDARKGGPQEKKAGGEEIDLMRTWHITRTA